MEKDQLKAKVGCQRSPAQEKMPGPLMKNVKYSMSFSTGGLFHQESLKLAQLYLELKDWDLVRNRVLSENLLQARTVASSKRSCREIINRLKTLYHAELELLVNTNHQEQGYILWIAICRRYKFIAEFSVEVIRERYISLKADLQHEDFDSFFNHKSEWHAELDTITPKTRVKLRQVLFKILREADLLNKDNVINTVLLGPRLLKALPHEHRGDVLFFPVFESDLGRILK
jgi:hypothetical protein